jgi:predicted acyl esterase
MISGVPQAEERRFSLRPGSFVSDPKDPVPYMGSLSPRRDKSYMWADQGFAAGRRDVYQHILFEAAADTLLAGPAEVHLKASCTGTDADFVVKLVDRAPDGSSSLVRADVMPARWRNSVRKAEPLPAGKSVSVFFTLNPICHVLKQGHSLAVQVQGSWFPLIPANPQVFLKNPYTDEPPQCRKAVMRIFRGSWISFGIKC